MKSFDLRVCCHLHIPSMLTQDFCCCCSVCAGEVDETLDGRLLSGGVCWRHGRTVSAGCDSRSEWYVFEWKRAAAG